MLIELNPHTVSSRKGNMLYYNILLPPKPTAALDQLHGLVEEKILI